jgi:hypothetical protein
VPVQAEGGGVCGRRTGRDQPPATPAVAQKKKIKSKRMNFNISQQTRPVLAAWAQRSVHDGSRVGDRT